MALTGFWMAENEAQKREFVSRAKPERAVERSFFCRTKTSEGLVKGLQSIYSIHSNALFIPKVNVDFHPKKHS